MEAACENPVLESEERYVNGLILCKKIVNDILLLCIRSMCF